ncbi:hypothetical protein FW778_22275 [Ginsengibacter hankyongi]|uniref:Uncharacterized protein n=1 Tax=Ginsengibacter hankyongi TaxID=2607284 RepID=A0A5J5IF29_9BACT|nr:hypothetical protein [Ginsengibacter hankyongi]KAA9034566.1 hypothetical protein FW778_22275 [Ginsengibacter hankyongi]
MSDDFIEWSATRKLTENDFIIKTKDLQSNTSFAQFYMDYQVSGFSFMSNNFNKKVRLVLNINNSLFDIQAEPSPT